MNVLDLLKFIVMHPLNTKGRFSALGRFIRWQIASRIFDARIGFPFVGDTFLLAKQGMAGATQNWYCGLHEPHDMGFVLHILRPDSLFLDIGANIGSYSVLAAGGVGSRVISVEPVPSTFRSLRANIFLNELDDLVELKCVGISDEPGVLSFTIGLDTVNHVVGLDGDSESIAVPVTTIDKICADVIPTVIKIDVEGYEKAALIGAKNTLESPDLLAVVMETNNSGLRYGVKDSDLFQIMHEFNFFPIGYNAITRRLTSRPAPSGNTIFIRNLEKVRLLVDSSPRYKLVNGWV